MPCLGLSVNARVCLFLGIVKLSQKMDSCPLLVISHSGISWHPAWLYLIYLPNLCVTNLRLWGHRLSVAPETSSMEGGARFHLDTSHHRPGPLVTRCDRITPQGMRGR